MALKSKDARIKAEKRRLEQIYDGLDSKKKKVASGLIERAAYLKATIEDLEADLDENGYVELFTQSERTAPYERRRPAADLYTATSGIYQKCIKQLTDLLPRESDTKAEVSDGFDGFVNNRDE